MSRVTVLLEGTHSCSSARAIISLKPWQIFRGLFSRIVDVVSFSHQVLTFSHQVLKKINLVFAPTLVTFSHQIYLVFSPKCCLCNVLAPNYVSFSHQINLCYNDFAPKVNHTEVFQRPLIL